MRHAISLASIRRDILTRIAYVHEHEPDPF